ncbi:hypothetical protein Ahy_B09g095026 [Arachis hypogaea]|uniref:Uncharacterized protein n=1 Tax=Arachis hypogaea TaxID=3818 RepID=A0A444XCS1_ARAHY|nr:hypothetical protein Ahy_B09g095026 [Arachis hypogaea]
MGNNNAMVKKMRDEYEKLNKAEVNIWKCYELLDEVNVVLALLINYYAIINLINLFGYIQILARCFCFLVLEDFHNELFLKAIVRTTSYHHQEDMLLANVLYILSFTFIVYNSIQSINNQ